MLCVVRDSSNTKLRGKNNINRKPYQQVTKLISKSSVNPGLVKSRYEQPSLDLAVKVQALAEVMYVVFSARLDVLYSHITRYH